MLLKIEEGAFVPFNQKTMDSTHEVEVFKSAVIRIRDILRGPGVAITGMDSMRHICLYILSRYMTRDKVAALNFPPELAWENIMELINTHADGLKLALHCYDDCTIDGSIISQFSKFFENTNVTFDMRFDMRFDIRNAQKHKEILEIMNNVNIHAVDIHIDILGWVYEQHLKTGSSSAARDLGQFFTDRAICEYMVHLCQPTFKSHGVPESMCDPSMGTGGFLTAYMKYFKNDHKSDHDPIDWSVQQKELHGCDTDAKLVTIARFNMFMESGGSRFNNLQIRNSLYDDLLQTGYDVILANMPFGLNGIKHADCCERVKQLRIRGTKSEPLFLQLMMTSLNKGGRCAVVVPDGMLVNTSVLHRETRAHLLNNFDLKLVIKIKGQFFMNTGIQPSILLFENNGRATTSVEFWEVEKTESNSIADNKLITVSRHDLDEDVSFDARKYVKNAQPVVTQMVYPVANLGDIATIEIGGTPLRANKAFYANGTNVWVSVSELNGNVIADSRERITDEAVRKSSVKLVKAGSVLMSFKLSIGKCALAGVDLYTNEAVAAINSRDPTTVLNKYIYYVLQTTDFATYGKGSIGNGSMNKKTLAQIPIIVPPVPIQESIIASLDELYRRKEEALRIVMNTESLARKLVGDVSHHNHNPNLDLTQP